MSNELDELRKGCDRLHELIADKDQYIHTLLVKINGMVPRSRLEAVERETKVAERKLTILQAAAKQEIKRLEECIRQNLS